MRVKEKQAIAVLLLASNTAFGRNTSPMLQDTQARHFFPVLSLFIAYIHQLPFTLNRGSHFLSVLNRISDLFLRLFSSAVETHIFSNASQAFFMEPSDHVVMEISYEERGR